MPTIIIAFMCINLFDLQKQSYKVATIVISILQVWKLRLKEAKKPAQVTQLLSRRGEI